MGHYSEVEFAGRRMDRSIRTRLKSQYKRQLMVLSSKKKFCQDSPGTLFCFSDAPAAWHEERPRRGIQGRRYVMRGGLGGTGRRCNLPERANAQTSTSRPLAPIVKDEQACVAAAQRVHRMYNEQCWGSQNRGPPAAPGPGSHSLVSRRSEPQ